jgi:Domain of unknown function (DUF4286)
MIIYNVTTAVSWQVHDAWLHWMKEVHIPEVMATQCFEKHQFVRLLETDETEGPTYAVQYFASNVDMYDLYIQQHSTALRQKAITLWNEQCISFRSLMETVS